MFNGRGAPYPVIGMVTRFVDEVRCAYDIELRRVCRYSKVADIRYSLTVHSGI
jgi:hypothetical protein